jgi:hypothetical protein
MKTRILLALLWVPWLAACSERIADGPAGQCAEVVRIYRNLESPVAVVGQPVTESRGVEQIGVEIEYEGMNAMNVPVEGSAGCSFAVDPQGNSILQGATLEGSALGESELAAIRRELGQRR